MKKIFVTLLIGMLSMSLFACGVNNEADQPQDEMVTVEDTTDQAEETPQDMQQPGQDGGQTEDAAAGNTDEEQETVTPQDGSPSQILLADFMDKMDSGQYEKTEDLANALMSNSIIPFATATMPVEPGFLTGFTDEIKGFSQGTMFGPSIGSIPFVGYVFQVDDDVDAFMQQLKDKSDMRWNICTQADETVVQSHGNMVFFLMAPATFGE